ncbi:hypothetical protein M3924_002991 [Vibrio fluvialis]|nr:hypothetical protein [Vibrio fluvialis]
MKNIFLQFNDNPYSGIVAFTNRLAESSSRKLDVIHHNEINWFDIFISPKIIILNFPNISVRKVYVLLFLLIAKICGNKIKLIVHEVESQSVKGRILLRYLLRLSNIVYSVSPGIKGALLEIMCYKKPIKLLIQGSNIPVINNSSPSIDKFVISIVGNALNHDHTYLDNILKSVAIYNSKNNNKVSIQFMGLKNSKFYDEYLKKYSSNILIKVLDGLSDIDFSKVLLDTNLVMLPIYDGFSARRSSIVTSLTHGIPCLVPPPTSKYEEDWLTYNHLPGLYFTSNFSESDIYAFLECDVSCLNIKERAREVFSYANSANTLLEP